MQILISSTNNVIVFNHGGEKYYFRECKKHVSEDRLIESIFLDWEVLTNTSHSFVIDNLRNRKAFLDMGIMNDVDSNLYQYFRDYNPVVLGFDSNVTNVINKEYFDTFINYAWSEILSWKINDASAPLQMTSANRILCQERIYKLFDVDRLICHSEPVTIIGCLEHKGIMMKSAFGVNPIKLSVEFKRKSATPLLHKELTILNVMDVLCYERDHRPGNYNVLLDDYERMTSVQAFDNDSVLTFLPIPMVSKSFVGSVPLIDKNGFFTRAHLEEEFANHFLSITDGLIIDTVSPFLNRLQQWALVKRFHKLKHSILKRMEVDNDFIVASLEWNSKMVEDDAKVGPSYYSILIEWEEQQKDPILLRQGALPPKLVTL